jgi:hypothetical protein
MRSQRTKQHRGTRQIFEKTFHVIHPQLKTRPISRNTLHDSNGGNLMLPMQIRQLLEKTGSVATEQRSLALSQLYRSGEE